MSTIIALSPFLNSGTPPPPSKARVATFRSCDDSTMITIMQTEAEWLAQVPRTVADLPTWLEAGRPFYLTSFLMGNAIKNASRDACQFDLERAEWLGRGLILLGEREGDESLIGLGEIALGDVKRVNGDLKGGIALLDQAAERFERIGNQVGWARTRIGWLGSIYFLENHPEVEPIVQRAMQIFVAQQEWTYFVLLSQNAATYYIQAGQLAEALALCEEAHRIAETIEPNEARYVPLLSMIALLIQTHSDLGNYTKAEAYIRTGQALIQTRATLDTVAVELLSRTSNFFLSTGRYNQALFYIEQARQAATREDIRRTLDFRAAKAYFYLNRLPDSERILLEKIQTLENNDENSLWRSVFFYQLAEVYRVAAQWDKALQTSESALTLMRKRNRSSDAWLNVMYRQYAFILMQTGQFDAAVEAIEQALELAVKANEHVERITTYLFASQILTDREKAWNVLHQADEMARTLPWLRWRVNQTMARLSTDQAVRRKALIQATDDLDFVQSSLSASFHADYLTEGQKLYDDLILDYIDSNEVVYAWQTLERAKSRALINTLMAQEEAVSDADSPHVAVLKALQLRHYELGKQMAEGRGDYDEVNAALEAVEGQIAEAQRDIEINQLGRREPLHVPQRFIPTADADTDLIGYYISESAIHIFVHNGEEYAYHETHVSGSELYDLLFKINLNMRQVPRLSAARVKMFQKQVQDLFALLYNYLIAPIRPHLRHEKLVIIPHGILHQLPFNLLYDGNAYLVEHYEIRTLPTARLLQRTATPSNRMTHHAVISHDWDGELPNAIAEGIEVAEMLGTTHHLQGMAAVKEKVVAFLNQRGILHIAAHGAYRPDRPELSHIRLEDGELTLLDLLRQPIHKDLVILSACETGLVDIRAGDDPVGLWRGFLAAGARSLLVALWKLEDAASRTLMRNYYQKLNAGTSRSLALREVQQEWLKTAEGVHQHPFYWGAYQLIGDDGFMPLPSFEE